MYYVVSIKSNGNCLLGIPGAFSAGAVERSMMIEPPAHYDADERRQDVVERLKQYVEIQPYGDTARGRYATTTQDFKTILEKLESWDAVSSFRFEGTLSFHIASHR